MRARRYRCRRCWFWQSGTYVRQGDYYLPCLSLPEEEQKPVGIWGQRHLRYLKQHRKILYTNLLTSGKLNSYLADIDRQAEEMFSRLVKQMAECEGVTEQLKAENQLEWVGKMNNIRSRAVEIIDVELICV
ncbi:MAG: TnpV protein [Planifilum sp.]